MEGKQQSTAKKILLIKIMKIVFTVLSNVIMVAFALTMIYLIVQSSTSGKKKIMGYQVIMIVTDSMEPTLYVNDVILIKNIPFQSLEKGDIITYVASSESEVEGEIVTHRVVSDIYYDAKLKQDAVKTLGDKEADYIAKREYSDKVTEATFYGVMIKKINFLTFFMGGNIFRLVMLFLVPLALCLGIMFLSSYMSKKKQKEQTKKTVESITDRAEKMKQEIAERAVQEFLLKQERKALSEVIEEQKQKEAEEEKDKNNDEDGFLQGKDD